jgi:2-polyprenyl-6-methoxyphenol hydroxylase-like FAD-dependent oxidoreductase
VAAFTTPILVVGGGPVGMVLGMWLDLLGVRSIVVNDEPAPRRQPKGSTQNARTMEHYRRLGIVDRVRAYGLPKDRQTDVVYFTRYNGHELQRLRMPSEREKLQARDTADATDQVVEPVFRCNQMEVEGFLFEHLGTLPLVERRFGWRCVGFVEDADGVDVEIEETTTGARETCRAAFVVGCDGGQSFVRRSLGIRYGGEAPTQQAYLGGPMVSTWMHAPALNERVIREPGWQYWAVNSEVRSNTVNIDGHAEVLFNTRLDSPDQVPDDDLVMRAFHASVGEPIDAEIRGHGTWTAGQAFVANSFGTRRVLLAGDAAHLFTPTGGFGVNTGIDDATNLAWKLAATVQGWGGPKLLETYELERRPIALRNTSAAKDLSRNVGAVPVSPALEDETPEGAVARAEAAAFLAGFGREFSSIGVQLGARYDGSPIVSSDGTQAPADDPVVYVPSASPGGRAPHVWLPDRTSLYDHLGAGFTLLRIGESTQDVSGLERAAAARGMPLGIFDVTSPAAHDLYECELALVRPDGHVAWRGDRPPDDWDVLLAVVTGW